MTNAVAQEVSYASLGQRALAFFLDSIVWLVLLGQIAANIPADVYEDAPVVVGVIFLGLFSVAFNYFWFAEWKFGSGFTGGMRSHAKYSSSAATCSRRSARGPQPTSRTDSGPPFEARCRRYSSMKT